jgi:hypothetical protein
MNPTVICFEFQDIRVRRNPLLLQKSLQKDNQAKWRNKISHKQIATFEGAVDNSLTNFGYPLITDAKPISLLVKAFLPLSNIIITLLRNAF